MIVGTLQFSPDLGKVAENIARTNALLNASPPSQHLDLLVLPELAFSGYNHTRESIQPLLEPSSTGPSTAWAKATAAKYSCIVSVGYPELVKSAPSNGTTPAATAMAAYNSTVTVSPEGEILAHYRKTHLYYTDELWAQEGPDKWLVKDLPLPLSSPNSDKEERVVKAAFGICMDLNPHRFTAPWDTYEFATFAREERAEVLVLSMAWLSSLPADEVREREAEPDMDTFAYWLGRLSPLLNDGGREVVVVCANRCGEESGRNPCGQVEEGVRYAGTSWVGRIGKGKVSVWGLLGRGEEGLLLVDTDDEPVATFSLARKADVEAQKRAEEMKA